MSTSDYDCGPLAQNLAGGAQLLTSLTLAAMSDSD